MPCWPTRPAGGRVDELEDHGLVRCVPGDVLDATSISSRSSAMFVAGSSCSPNISSTISRWSCSGVEVLQHVRFDVADDPALP